MTSISTTKSLSNRFRSIAEKTVAVVLLNRIHVQTDTEHSVPFVSNHWRPVENLNMSNPPGIALLNKDGNVSLIKWPTDDEIKSITELDKYTHRIEIARGEYHYTYSFRTSA